jgi:hypothetical protein
MRSAAEAACTMEFFSRYVLACSTLLVATACGGCQRDDPELKSDRVPQASNAEVTVISSDLPDGHSVGRWADDPSWVHSVVEVRVRGAKGMRFSLVDSRTDELIWSAHSTYMGTQVRVALFVRVLKEDRPRIELAIASLGANKHEIVGEKQYEMVASEIGRGEVDLCFPIDEDPGTRSSNTHIVLCGLSANGPGSARLSATRHGGTGGRAVVVAGFDEGLLKKPTSEWRQLALEVRVAAVNAD